MDKIYLVKYTTGSYHMHKEITIFATATKSKATKYCTKFNKILKKWREYYSRYEGKKYLCMNWIKDEYVQQYFDRWNMLTETNRCYYEEVEIR